ncbi:hypothetical protein ACTG0T_13700 [Halococcus morrhuae DSM 1307]|nr:hypothetical protein [Halococcus morrhuae]
MSPYQRCPYCETVIEINSDDKERLKRHIRVEHPDDEQVEQCRAA